MAEQPALSETIASTATIKLARIPDSVFFCTPIEERFERITRLARRALNVPVAAVTFVNIEKQWFKSVAGWMVTELPHEKSFCPFTLETGGLTVIEDAREDERTRDHPLVVSSPRFGFYAGFPLRDETNSAVGTFCIFDRNPRSFSMSDRETFLDFATLTQREILSEQLRGVHTAITTKLGSARREAMMDPLTRLWNRRGASMLINSTLKDADRNKHSIALAVLDLDNFKRVNDTYGHQIGDEVLRKTAARLIRNIRGGDIICRTGGDEFLLLMTDADGPTAAAVAERVRRSVTFSPVPTRDGNIPMSVSVGYTLREPGEEITVDELIERADQGLMRSKSMGRDRVATVD